MLSRTREPEVMDTAEEAVDYNQMDHSNVNRRFVDDFLRALELRDPTEPRCVNVFDAGTGTALIPIELIQRDQTFFVTASDLAQAMLVVARENILTAGLEASIQLILSDCKRLPDGDGAYDAVMSNSIVHHIPEPRSVLAELWRILKPGGILFVRDLMRPDDIKTLENLVQTYAGDANSHQQKMFRESLHAALTVDEVRELVGELGISGAAVQPTSDRHWTICVKKRNMEFA